MTRLKRGKTGLREHGVAQGAEWAQAQEGWGQDNDDYEEYAVGVQRRKVAFFIRIWSQGM